jgi:hypothetical protein
MISINQQFMVIHQEFCRIPHLGKFCDRIKEWVDWTVQHGKLCSCYPIPKKHKKGDVSRLIQPNTLFTTTGASKFLSDVLTPYVSKHPRNS